MTTISGNEALSQYALQTGTTAKGKQDLGKNEFMELMLAQLNHQDPLKPQDNGQFISQLAQFSSLEEMQKMSSTVSGAVTQFRSSQALQASAMVGRSVVVPSATATFAGSGVVSGFIDLPATTSSLQVSVMNSAGELVGQYDLGAQEVGQVPFVWDGKDASGNALPPGKYTLKAEGRYSGGSEQLETLISTNVDSVSLGRDGSITLNLAGLGPMSLSDVRQIN